MIKFSLTKTLTVFVLLTLIVLVIMLLTYLDLDCRFCDVKILETQEHLGECRGLSWERRNLKMDTEGGKINFFKRVEKKLGWSSTSPAAAATTWFINCLPLLLNLVFHNCTLFDFADFLIIIIIIFQLFEFADIFQSGKSAWGQKSTLYLAYYYY